MSNDRFNSLRKRVFAMIEKELAIDCECKSYEGAIEVIAEYPNYFDDRNAEQKSHWYCIVLHCYVLGNCRHHEFKGKTFTEALNKFEKQIAKWERRYDNG